MVDKERRWNRWDKSYVYRKKNGWLNLFSMRYDTAKFSELKSEYSL